MKKQVPIAIIIVLLLVGTFLFLSQSGCTSIGSFTACINDWFHSYAIITPSQNITPGQTVAFDSRMLMNCGLCDITRYQTTIKGYVIKVYNPTGNMLVEQSFANDLTQLWALKCGQYGNVYYSYLVPSDATSGAWNIKLEVAVSPSNPFGGQTDCIVATDQGTFSVNGVCSDYAQQELYCYNENVLLSKPANSCSVTYTNCGEQHGAGFKCLNAQCQKVEVCGDGTCDENENPYSCYADCGRCGDNICQSPTENTANCPQDCSTCGDGRCDSREELNCPLDCHEKLCGNGVCDSWEKSGTYACPQDCSSVCAVEGATCGGLLDKQCCSGLTCAKQKTITIPFLGTFNTGGGTCVDPSKPDYTQYLPFIILGGLGALIGWAMTKKDEWTVIGGIAGIIAAYIFQWASQNWFWLLIAGIIGAVLLIFMMALNKRLMA